jgi:hypothetical protein
VPLAHHHELPRLRQVLSCLRIVHIRSYEYQCHAHIRVALERNHPLEVNTPARPFRRH